MTTINDVAREAGVSISTVSYVLSGKRPVGNATRARVMKAIGDLNFQVNAGARMLAGNRTQIIALAAPMHSQTHPPAFMAFVLSVVTAAREAEYDVLLLTETDPEESIRRVVTSRLVDAVILMDVGIDDSRVPLLRELKVPAAVIGLPRDRNGLVFIDLDFEAAAEIIVDKLVSLGHRDIGLVGHPEALYERGSGFAVRFRNGFRESVERRGLEYRFAGSDDEAAVASLCAAGGPTALVLNCNEREHRQVLRELEASGRQVPRDVSLVSACSSFSTDDFDPPLDYVPLTPEESGRRAVDLALAAIRGARRNPHVELISPTYIERKSTAPPKEPS